MEAGARRASPGHFPPELDFYHREAAKGSGGGREQGMNGAERREETEQVGERNLGARGASPSLGRS